MAYRISKTRRQQRRKSRRTRSRRTRSRRAGMISRVGKSVARHSGDVLKEIVVGEAQNKWKGQDTLIDKYDKAQKINTYKPNIYHSYDKENAPKQIKTNYNYDFDL